MEVGLVEWNFVELRETRQFYLALLEEASAGRFATSHKVQGVEVDRTDDIARWQRNITEIDWLFEVNGVAL